MRADMGKVLVERPRPGSRDGSRPRKGYRTLLRKELAEGSPRTKEGMLARSGGTRWFNEHLAPLRRFLNSNAGRPWNKVYAEICAHVDRGNVVQKHILTHLFDYVVTNAIVIDGVSCNGTPGRLYGSPLAEADSHHRWFVCPKSGLLRRCRYVPRSMKRVVAPRRVPLNKSQMCLKLNGQWELVTVMPIPEAPASQSGYDVVRKRRVSSWYRDVDEARALYGDSVYATSRRPLSRPELLAMPIPIEWLN